MKKYRRIFVVVLDSLGAGAMDDAAQYGDAGTDTLGHISASVEQFAIPNLQKLGLANLLPLKQVGTGRASACAVYDSAGSELCQGHDDGTLGNDGLAHDGSV